MIHLSSIGARIPFSFDQLQKLDVKGLNSNQQTFDSIAKIKSLKTFKSSNWKNKEKRIEQLFELGIDNVLLKKCDFIHVKPKYPPNVLNVCSLRKVKKY